MRKLKIDKFINTDIASIIDKYDYYFNGFLDFSDGRDDESTNCIERLPNGGIIRELDNNSLVIWYPNLPEKILKGHTDNINCLTVLPDGRIASGSNDKTIRIWNTETLTAEKILIGHTHNINCLSVLPDGRIVSASDDLRVWNINTGETDKILKHSESIINLSVFQNGQIVCASNNILVLWTVETNDIRMINVYIKYLEILSDGNIACIFWDSSLRLLNPLTNNFDKILSQHKSDIYCFSVLYDGCIVTGSWDDTIIIWNRDTYKILKGHSGFISCLAILLDVRIISGSYDRTLRIWDPETGETQKYSN